MDKSTIKNFIKNNKVLTISFLLGILLTATGGFEGFLVALSLISIPLAAVYFYKFKKGYINTKYHYYILAAGLVAFVVFGITAKPIDNSKNAAVKNNLLSSESTAEETQDQNFQEQKDLVELKSKKIESLTEFEFLTNEELIKFINEINKQESLSSINNVLSKAKLQNDKNKKENDPINNYKLAKLTSITAGDTITIEVDEKEYELKLTGLETPNSNSDKDAEFLGKEAADFTKSQLTNRDIWIEKDAIEANTNNKTIRSYVWLTLPRNPKKPSYEEVKNNTINGVLISKGYAKVNTSSSNDKYSNWSNKMEQDAQTSGIGIWNESEKTSWEANNPQIMLANTGGNSQSTGQNGSQQNRENNATPNAQQSVQQTIQKVVEQTVQPTTQEIVEETTLSPQDKWTRITAKVTSRGKTYLADITEGPVKGNTNSKIYHVIGQNAYNKISVNNVVWFNTEEDARAAGYTRAQK